MLFLQNMKRAAQIIVVLIIITEITASEEFISTENEIIKNNLLDSREKVSETDEPLPEQDEKSEKYTFRTEVSRMMNIIINSLYQNKDIYLRELLSNASDALNKIRLLSLTDKNALDSNPEISIKIKIDKSKKILSITDTGIGMTKQDLIDNLGTLAKSGTAEFLNKMQTSDAKNMNDMIGQFGLGFYSVFLVANKVSVTTKHNNDKQYIWESDTSSFSIVEDPQGSFLKRGTTVSLHLKDDAMEFLEPDTIKNLIKKYSQFINFPIYLWNSKIVEVEENESEDNKEKEKEVHVDDESDEDANVEDASEQIEQKKIKKTVWDWELLNHSKPIWTLKPSEISDEEYNNFYKTIANDLQDPLAVIHFHAEGEVNFKALLFIPKVQPSENFKRYGTKTDSIKLYARRVLISDKFNEKLPSYLSSFVKGIVDSDDLPLNVSRENLQKSKLLTSIVKKIVRKILDSIKNLTDYMSFWKEYSTNIKLGIADDSINKIKLSKLLMFHTSAQNNLTSLKDYILRAKPNQKYIYYIAGSSLDEVKKSPFTERLLKDTYEVLYLTEAIDELTLSGLSEFEGKKFQNVAKEGLVLDDNSNLVEEKEKLIEKFESLTKYLSDLFKEHVSKVLLSDRLVNSSCALVSSMFGWTGNMERLAISNAHQKSDDPQKSYYLNQKKILEINPRHPLMRELLRRIELNKEDKFVEDMAVMMFQIATLRSGYMLRKSSDFAQNVEKLMSKTMEIPMEEVEESFENFSTDRESKNSVIEKELNEDHDEL